MRSPAFQKAVRGRQVSQTTSVPAPIKGWNAKDSLAAMEQDWAVSTDNWFGKTTDIRVRKGHSDHVTGIGAHVESLMPYNKQDGTQTLFAAAGTDIFNVTSAGSVGAAVVSSLTNGRWQHINFTNSAGNSYLCCFNGTDAPRYWDGSSWTTVTGASSPAITGITTTNIVNGCVFKRRLYLILNNSLSLYYLPVDSVGGAVNSTRMDGYFSKGGWIVSCETWTLDAGEGVDDHLVVVSSEGQVAVFKGTNPSSASSWELSGIWNLGEPIGRRCLIKYRGDLAFLSVEGVFPLSKALGSAQLNKEVALSYNIQDAISAASNNYKTVYGWNMALFPQGNQLIVNIPILENSQTEQYVMNTITGSWWRWTGVVANCWAVLDEKCYFGGNGVVGLYGIADNDNGENIVTGMKQAFSYLRSPGRVKQVNAVRPNFLASTQPAVTMSIAVDFGEASSGGSLSFNPAAGGVWDTGTWDNALWGGDVSVFNGWQTVGAIGTAVALQMTTETNGIDLRFSSSDWVYEYGGVLV